MFERTEMERDFGVGGERGCCFFKTPVGFGDRGVEEIVNSRGRWEMLEICFGVSR